MFGCLSIAASKEITGYKPLPRQLVAYLSRRILYTFRRNFNALSSNKNREAEQAMNEKKLYGIFDYINNIIYLIIIFIFAITNCVLSQEMHKPTNNNYQKKNGIQYSRIEGSVIQDDENTQAILIGNAPTWNDEWGLAEWAFELPDDINTITSLTIKVKGDTKDWALKEAPNKPAKEEAILTFRKKNGTCNDNEDGQYNDDIFVLDNGDATNIWRVPDAYYSEIIVIDNDKKYVKPIIYSIDNYKAEWVSVDIEYEPNSLTVSPLSLDFGSDKTSESLTITSNTSWSISGDENWISVIQSVDNGSGTATVKVDRNGLSSGSYKGKVSVTGGGITREVSISMIVSTRDITVTSPQEDDNWAQGTFKEITWISNDAGSSVNIELNKGGGSFRLIDEKIFNHKGENSYNWKIQNDIPDAGDFKIKISSIDYPSINDESENFSINKIFEKIEIFGNNSVNEGKSESYTCEATYSNSDIIDVTSSAKWTENSDYADIGEFTGKLTTSDVPSPQVCKITATFGGKQDTKDVTIKDIDKGDVPCGNCGAGSLFSMALVFGYVMVMKRRNNNGTVNHKSHLLG